MEPVVVDTDVLSFVAKGDTRALPYSREFSGKRLCICFQTVAELWSWAEENDWGTTLRAGLEIFLQKFLVIPYDPELAKTWARLATHCKRIGRRLEAGDAWIAASAVHYKLLLLTHDLDQVGLNFPDLKTIYYS